MCSDLGRSAHPGGHSGHERPTAQHPSRLACMPEDEEHVVCRREPMSCPLNLWLDAPLGHRVVIDFDSEKEVPLNIPHWGTDEPSEYVPCPPGNLWPPDR
jgi:hypothetical protein